MVGSSLECGKELGILNPGSCDVDTKFSDLRPFECELWRRRRGTAWLLVSSSLKALSHSPPLPSPVTWKSWGVFLRE